MLLNFKFIYIKISARILLNKTINRKNNTEMRFELMLSVWKTNHLPLIYFRKIHNNFYFEFKNLYNKNK